MAIKRLDPKATTKLVSLKDDAVDLEKTDMKAYIENLDITAVAFKEDAKPTFFIVRSVPASLFAEMNDKHYQIDDVMVDERDLKSGKTKAPKIKLINQTSMMLSYFNAGVTHIEEDGKKTEITDELLETIPHDIRNEVGGYVFRRTNLGDRIKKP